MAPAWLVPYRSVDEQAENVRTDQAHTGCFHVVLVTHAPGEAKKQVDKTRSGDFGKSKHVSLVRTLRSGTTRLVR